MTKRDRFVLGAAVLLLSAHIDLGACGDKFLRLGRVLRLAHSAYPSSILIYSGTDAGAAGVAKQLKLGQTLKQAGHKVKEIARGSDLAPALSSGSYDLVLGAPTSVAAMPAAGAPLFVPLLLKPTAEERARAEQQFGAVLTAAVTSQELITKLDAVLGQGRLAKASR